MSKSEKRSKGPSLVIESEADPTIFEDEPIEAELEELLDEAGDAEEAGAEGATAKAGDEGEKGEEKFAAAAGTKSKDGKDALASKDGEAEADAKDPSEHVFMTICRSLATDIWKYTEAHPHTVLFGLVGFVLALLVFIIGFWTTLVLALFILIGVAIGQIVDGDGVFARLFQRLIRRDQE